jgi:GNAT superfamily N-acetyltransferase
MTVNFRPAMPEDADQIGVIAAASAGKGTFGARQHLCVDAYTAFTRHPHTEGIVGYTTDSRVVSYVFYRPVNLAVNGELTPSLFGFNGAVHPDYRRLGVGQETFRALYKLTLDLGVHLLLVEAEGINSASRNLILKGGFSEAGRYVRIMIPTRRRPSRLPAGVRVRRAELSDLAAWAAAVNDFYQCHEFWQPVSAELLEAWVNPDHAGIRRDLYLAEDSQGRLLAGMGSDDCNQLFSWVLDKAPRPVEIGGRVLGMLDKQGRIRVIRVMIPWYGDANAGTARALWQWLRWHMRQDASVITISYDPRSPVRDAVVGSFFLPTREGYRYVPANLNVDKDRPIVADIL